VPQKEAAKFPAEEPEAEIPEADEEALAGDAVEEDIPEIEEDVEEAKEIEPEPAESEFPEEDELEPVEPEPEAELDEIEEIPETGSGEQPLSAERPEAKSKPDTAEESGQPAKEPVIPPEDTLGTEEEIKSKLDKIDAEEIPPPPEPKFEPEPPQTPEDSGRPAKKPKPEERIKLLDYLMTLTACLPENKRSDFKNSDYPLKLEAVKNMLRGKQGLHREFPEGRQEPAGQSVTPDKLKKSFGFVSQLADYLPNQDLRTVLRKKLKTIADRLSKPAGEKHL
jgi:hypothetical protein